MDTADAFPAPGTPSVAGSLLTPALVGANVVVFLVLALHGAGWLMPDGQVVARFGSNYTPWTLGGESWRLISNTFIHLGVLHLALNAWALVAVGPAAERLYGPARLALVYFASGFGGSLASVWWHPVVNSAGASGAIFGVLGALLASCAGRWARAHQAGLAARRAALIAITGPSLLFGAVVPGVDNAAHVGGLVTGFACGLLFAGAPAIGRGRARSSRRLVFSVLLLATITTAILVAVQAGVVQPRDPLRVCSGLDVRPDGQLARCASLP